jgi:hypothetical protein
MEANVPLMSRKDRLRRVALLCAHFTRNLAYYRAAQDRIARTSPEFWRTVYSNFLDIAVLEWCKLFDDSLTSLADKAGFQFLDRPRRREAARCHNADIRVGTGACHRPSSTETAPNRIASTIMIGQSFG